MFEQLHGRRWRERWRPGDEEMLAASGSPVRPACDYRSDMPPAEPHREALRRTATEDRTSAEPHLEALRRAATEAWTTGPTALHGGPTGPSMPVRPPEAWAEANSHGKPVRPPASAVRPVLSRNVQRGPILVLSGISARSRWRSDRPPRRSDRHLSGLSREDPFLVLSGISAKSRWRSDRPPRRSDRSHRSDRHFNAGSTGQTPGPSPTPATGPTGPNTGPTARRFG